MRLIDADALIAEISNPKYPYTYDAERVFKRMIDNAPTVDAVSVVRCKDCKHFDGENCCMESGLIIPDGGRWFCADGERRGGND